MKIWHISDTHTYHDLLEIPKNIDLVIFSGDCSNVRDPYINEREVKEFITWFKDLPIKHKVFVAGNHDSSIEKGLINKGSFKDVGIVYLENEYVTIDSVTIFGSPLTPDFGQWSFMKSRHKLSMFWEKAITKYADIFVVHGPPKNILDKSYNRNYNMEACGDKALMRKVLEFKPKLMLFGHIHNTDDIINAGTRTIPNQDTIFSNGSVVTDGKFGKLTSNGNILKV